LPNRSKKLSMSSMKSRIRTFRFLTLKMSRRPSIIPDKLP